MARSIAIARKPRPRSGLLKPAPVLLLSVSMEYSSYLLSGRDNC
jgi:hypothetical protein